MSGREHDIAFYDLMIKTSEAIDNKLDTVTGTPGELAAWGSNNDIVSSGIVPGSCAFIDMTMGENEDADHDLADDEVYFRSKAKLTRPESRLAGDWRSSTMYQQDVQSGKSPKQDILVGMGKHSALLSYPNDNHFSNAEYNGTEGVFIANDINEQGIAIQSVRTQSVGKHRIFDINLDDPFNPQAEVMEIREYPAVKPVELHASIPTYVGNVFNPAVTNRASWFVYKRTEEFDDGPDSSNEYTVYEMINPTRGTYGTRYTLSIAKTTEPEPTFYILRGILTVKWPNGEIYVIDTDDLKVVDRESLISPGFYKLVEEEVPEPVEGEEPVEPRKYVEIVSQRVGVLLSAASDPEAICRFYKGIYGFKDVAGGWTLRLRSGELVRVPEATGLYWAEDIPMFASRVGTNVQIWPLNDEETGVKEGLALPNIHLIKQTSKGLFLFEKQDGGLPAGGDYMTAVAVTRNKISIHSYGQTGLYFGSTKSYNPWVKAYGVGHLHDSIPFIRRAGPKGLTIEVLQHPKFETVASATGSNVEVDGFVQEIINGNAAGYFMYTSMNSQVCYGKWPSWIEVAEM